MNHIKKTSETDSILKIALRHCKLNSHWRLSNKVLYDLCKQYPYHVVPEQIVAKVLMIGRVYAVALERIKTKIHINDDFYLEAIVPLFQNPEFDQRIEALCGKTLADKGIFEETLRIHAYLVKLIGRLESEERYLKKRSFASKYLHFHFPELFFIYDSRAQDSMKLFGFKNCLKMKELIKQYELDEHYAQFAGRCRKLQDQLKFQGEQLNNREIDNLLVYIANDRLKNRKEKMILLAI